MNDREILDWLQEQQVDVIYLDDGKIIDVRGGSVRKAIQRSHDLYEDERPYVIRNMGEGPA